MFEFAPNRPIAIMAKYKVYHTHPNPKKGRNEPLLVVVPGAECDECPKQSAGAVSSGMLRYMDMVKGDRHARAKVSRKGGPNKRGA